jgi:hypothetical protein
MSADRSRPARRDCEADAMAFRAKDPLDEIETGAMDPKSDLTTVLRRCISLGGVLGSPALRQWASLELKGYNERDEVPEYRKYVAPLCLDGFVPGGKVTGQIVPADMIPADMRDALMGDLEFRQPISELVDLHREARSDRGARLAPPGMSYVVTIINANVAANMRVERVYWAVSAIPLARTIEAVRTNLIELVAEMRAGTPGGAELPSGAVADQAVKVVVKGLANRVVYNSVEGGVAGDVTTTIGGTTSTGITAPEPKSRRVGWWIVAAATVVAAVVGVLALVQ